MDWCLDDPRLEARAEVSFRTLNVNPRASFPQMFLNFQMMKRRASPCDTGMKSSIRVLNKYTPSIFVSYSL